MRDVCLLPRRRFDGAQRRFVEGGWVAVRGGRVEAVGEGTPPPDLPPLSLPTLVEPLSDAHVHLFLSGDFDLNERRKVAGLSRSEAIARALGLLADYRKNGIALVRDGGDPHGVAVEAARIADVGACAAVLPSGAPLFHPEGQGAFLGNAIPFEEFPQRIEQNRAQGVSQVKVLATGLNSLDRAGEVGPRALSPDQLRRVGLWACEAGLPVMAHANGPLADVLAMSPFSVEHGFGCGEEDLRRMAGEGIYWTPTYRAWEALEGHPGLTGAQREVVALTARRQRDAVARAAQLRVPMLTGSDAGTPGVSHVSGFYEELAALADAGAPWESLLGESVAFARTRRGGNKGLRVGDEAEFSVFSDPLRPPEKVYFDGRFISSST